MCSAQVTGNAWINRDIEQHSKSDLTAWGPLEALRIRGGLAGANGTTGVELALARESRLNRIGLRVETG